MARRKAKQAALNDEPITVGITVGFLGSLLVTLGFIVQNIAEAITISELREREQNPSPPSSNKDNGNGSIQQLTEIQSKLDFLINEIETLKKRG